MSDRTDQKTKDFLEKIDFLISKGIIKNSQEVINELNWNKSVMSSVRKGTLPVPQHIYNKFKEVYAPHFTNGNGVDLKDKIISILEEQLAEKKTLLQEMQKRMIAIEEELKRVTSSLAKAQVNQVVMATSQQSYQEFWLDHQPPKGMTSEKAKSEVGKRAKQLLDLLEKGGLGT